MTHDPQVLPRATSLADLDDVRAAVIGIRLLEPPEWRYTIPREQSLALKGLVEDGKYGTAQKRLPSGQFMLIAWKVGRRNRR